jgi:cytochrome c oxidase assembly protein subunit 15
MRFVRAGRDCVTGCCSGIGVPPGRGEQAPHCSYHDGVHGLISRRRGSILALGRATTLRRLALGSVVANVGIVITGGAVRLTASGLGCPTWPRCTEDSFVATSEMGVHGVIEYGNRLLTGVVALIAVLGLVSALRQRPRRPSVTRLAAAVFAGIAAQALLGGSTVLTGLNPWLVGAHFLLSMAVIAAAYAFWRATLDPDDSLVPCVPRPLRGLVGLVIVVGAAVLVAGTLVTGSGPHAGSPTAGRNGLGAAAVAQLHADLVFLLIGLSVGTWFALRAVDARAAAVRAAWLIGLELAQGVVGVVQYVTHLPVLAVGLHMAGACAVWLAILALWFAARTRVAGRATDAGAPASIRSLAGQHT